MNKVLIFGGAALAAVLPAVAGLAANPSLSRSVPVPDSQVRPVQDPPTASPTGPATVSPSAVHSPGGTRTSTHSASVDDHGGDRPRGVSDDGPGDDKGGDRNRGDDDSGSGKHGGGHGSDD